MSSLALVLLGALAVIVGALIPVQAAKNAAMSRAIGSVAIASLALFAIGFVVVAAWAIVIRQPLPSLETLRRCPTPSTCPLWFVKQCGGFHGASRSSR